MVREARRTPHPEFFTLAASTGFIGLLKVTTILGLFANCAWVADDVDWNWYTETTFGGSVGSDAAILRSSGVGLYVGLLVE